MRPNMISENMDAEVRSLRQAHRNTNDGISVIQTAEGASGEVADMLKRMQSSLCNPVRIPLERLSAPGS